MDKHKQVKSKLTIYCKLCVEMEDLTLCTVIFLVTNHLSVLCEAGIYWHLYPFIWIWCLFFSFFSDGTHKLLLLVHQKHLWD